MVENPRNVFFDKSQRQGGDGSDCRSSPLNILETRQGANTWVLWGKLESSMFSCIPRSHQIPQAEAIH